MEVLTGSFEYPVVGGAPRVCGRSIVRSCRTESIPCEARAASSAASETCETFPSPPAAAKASAMVRAQAASWSLAASHLSNPVTTPSALRDPWVQRAAKSASLPRRAPGLPESSALSVAEPVAKDRRSLGRAADTPPPPPPLPGAGVWRTPERGAAVSTRTSAAGGPTGGSSAPMNQSTALSSQFASRSSRRCFHSRANRRRSFSLRASSFSLRAPVATSRSLSESSSASAEATRALSANSSEKRPLNSVPAVATYVARDPACDSMADAAVVNADIRASAVPSSNVTSCAKTPRSVTRVSPSSTARTSRSS